MSIGQRHLDVVITPRPAARYRAELWSACLRGAEPAESLNAYERENLVAVLVDAGYSDLDIALHTRMTVYTTARIRGRLELPANSPRQVAA